MGDYLQLKYFLAQIKEDSNMFVCFMGLLKDKIRDKTYFGTETCFKIFQNRLLQILETLTPIPPMNSHNQQSVNFYLAAFGSLLGLFLRF